MHWLVIVLDDGFFHCRLTPQQGSAPGATSTLQSTSCQLGGTSPLVMPVFPLRPAHASSQHHYSPYSPSRFHIDKRCQHRCSWKCLSIVLILLAVALTAMLAYFAGKHPRENASTTTLIEMQVLLFLHSFLPGHYTF